jgi:hypothetical protein
MAENRHAADDSGISQLAGLEPGPNDRQMGLIGIDLQRGRYFIHILAMPILRGLLRPRTRTRRGLWIGEPCQQSLHLHRTPLAAARGLDAAIVERLRDIAARDRFLGRFMQARMPSRRIGMARPSSKPNGTLRA